MERSLRLDLVTRTHSRGTRLSGRLDVCPIRERPGEAACSQVFVVALRPSWSRLLRIMRTSHARPDTRAGSVRYYRCAARARYPGIADADALDVLVPEQPIVTALEEWLDELFAPDRASETAQEIVAAVTHGPDRDEHIVGARQRISAVRREVERCRAALRDASSEPARREVLTWLDEAAAEKEHAEAVLSAAMELVPPVLSVEDVLAVVEHCGGFARRPRPGHGRGTRRALRSDRSQRRLQRRKQRGPTRRRPRCFNSVSEGGPGP